MIDRVSHKHTQCGCRQSDLLLQQCRGAWPGLAGRRQPASRESPRGQTAGCEVAAPNPPGLRWWPRWQSLSTAKAACRKGQVKIDLTLSPASLMILRSYGRIQSHFACSLTKQAKSRRFPIVIRSCVRILEEFVLGSPRGFRARSLRVKAHDRQTFWLAFAIHYQLENWPAAAAPPRDGLNFERPD